MRSNSRGMTLIEVLVAFVILSLTMAVLMQIFSGGMRNARLASGYSRAVFLAESRLAAAGVEQALVPGEAAGQVSADLRWRVRIAAIEDDGVIDRQTMQTRLYEVRVWVDWSDDGRARQIELASFRLGPPP